MKRNFPYRPIMNSLLDTDLYSHQGQPVFFTIRAYQDCTPFCTQPLCDMAISTLLEMARNFNCLVHAYCLMLDHLHYLISPNEEGVSTIRFTDQYKGKTTNQSWQLGWTGKLWQPRYYDHLVGSDESLSAICEYILQNPIRKGLVESISDWPWCGIVNE